VKGSQLLFGACLLAKKPGHKSWSRQAVPEPGHETLVRLSTEHRVRREERGLPAIRSVAVGDEPQDWIV